MGLTPEPVLLWQDLPGLITNVGLIPGQQAEEGSIAVSTADKVGNAVIGIRIGGAVRWSWHIWVTRYDPDAELVAYGKIYTWDNNGDGVVDYTFMDRNLGATIDKAIIENTAADSLAACGLMYQWGRKDPFPGDQDSPPFEQYRFPPFRQQTDLRRGGTSAYRKKCAGWRYGHPFH